MATSNIKLFDENKGNMLSDSEFNISNQRLNGLQTGVASSQLQNKAMYQASLVAYAIAQVMMQNGLNANDTDAVSAFVANLSGTMLQKVYDIATTAEAQAGVATGKWMSPALVKAAIDALAAKAQNILSDETKALFGLNATAVPDDAFVRLALQNINKLVIEKIVTSKNWVAPKAVGQLFKVYACGGGGGGGGGGNNSSYRQYGGGGGGGGYVRIGTFSIPNGESVSVVCGAGGSGGIEKGDGSRGGTTQFGTYLSAEGGYGGQGVTSDSGTNGGNGGAGGGAGRSGQAGGNGDIYGGGGGASGNIGASGGNGGTYGGGGGGYTPGTGGEHGTNGTSLQSSTIDAPYSFTDPLINILLRTDLINQSLSARTGFYLGGNGYGSIGGNGSTSYNSGGGGGYCGNGGNAQASSGGCGGAGNYCGNGGNSKSYGGGGGGGLFANGGDSSDPSNQSYVGGGGGAGIIDGTTSTITTQGGNGGSGGCYIVYIKGE